MESPNSAPLKADKKGLKEKSCALLTLCIPDKGSGGGESPNKAEWMNKV